MPFANVRGIRVAYDDLGEGDDVVLLVHGHPFDRSMWRAQADAAARAGWRAVVPDLRGYGETTVVPGSVRLEDHADDLVALLDHLGVERVVAVGLSMGGQIVMALCHQYPERVRGVVLAATFPQAEHEEGRRNRRRLAERLTTGEYAMADYARDLLPKMLAAQTIAGQPDVADSVLGMMSRAHAEGAAASLRGRAERRGYEDTLAALAVPALVVVGSEDAFTTRADAEAMHRLVEGSELVWMEGVGHMPNLERREEFDARLGELLLSVRSGEAVR